MNSKLKAEILQVFDYTDNKPLDGLSNITFLTFLLANFKNECIKEMFPALYKHYKGAIDE